MVKSGSLPKLRLWKLEKYLEHFMLSNAKNFKKQQKLWFIQKHIASNNDIEQNEVASSQNQVCRKLSLFTSPPKNVHKSVSRSEYSLIKVTFCCDLEVTWNWQYKVHQCTQLLCFFSVSNDATLDHFFRTSSRTSFCKILLVKRLPCLQRG